MLVALEHGLFAVDVHAAALFVGGTTPRQRAGGARPAELGPARTVLQVTDTGGLAGRAGDGARAQVDSEVVLAETAVFADSRGHLRRHGEALALQVLQGPPVGIGAVTEDLRLFGEVGHWRQ